MIRDLARKPRRPRRESPWLRKACAELLGDGSFSLGVHNDANIAVLDDLYDVDALPGEFSRLEPMSEDERTIVMAVAMRHLDFHHATDDDPLHPATAEAPGPEQWLAGLYRLVIELRRESTQLLRFTSSASATTAIIRKVDIGKRPIALAQVSVHDPASDGFGFAELTLLTLSDCSQHLSEFAATESDIQAQPWTRSAGELWEPGQQHLAVRNRDDVQQALSLLS